MLGITAVYRDGLQVGKRNGYTVIESDFLLKDLPPPPTSLGIILVVFFCFTIILMLCRKNRQNEGAQSSDLCEN